MRRGGRRLSWRDILNGTGYVGNLMMCRSIHGSQVFEQAELTSQGGITKVLLPILYEPVLIGIAPLAMQLRGFERMREPEGFYSVIQEWHCVSPD